VDTLTDRHDVKARQGNHRHGTHLRSLHDGGQHGLHVGVVQPCVPHDVHKCVGQLRYAGRACLLWPLRLARTAVCIVVLVVFVLVRRLGHGHRGDLRSNVALVGLCASQATVWYEDKVTRITRTPAFTW
jgi:hypothetical protein